MSLRMTKEEREAFLSAVRVGILSIADPGHGPLAAPIWYDYEHGGDLWFVTGRDSRKGRLLKLGVRISLCAQTESPPYSYVSVEGPVTDVSLADVETVTRPMAHRYLGLQGGDAYIESTGGEDSRDGSIVVRMTPERWLTVDYGKR